MLYLLNVCVGASGLKTAWSLLCGTNCIGHVTLNVEPESTVSTVSLFLPMIEEWHGGDACGVGTLFECL